MGFLRDFITNFNRMIVDILHVNEIHRQDQDAINSTAALKEALAENQHALDELKSVLAEGHRPGNGKAPEYQSGPDTRDSFAEEMRHLKAAIRQGIITPEDLARDQERERQAIAAERRVLEKELRSKGITKETATHYGRLAQTGHVPKDIVDADTRYIENLGQKSKISDRVVGQGWKETTADGKKFQVTETFMPDGSRMLYPTEIKDD